MSCSQNGVPADNLIDHVESVLRVPVDELHLVWDTETRRQMPYTSLLRHLEESSGSRVSGLLIIPRASLDAHDEVLTSQIHDRLSSAFHAHYKQLYARHTSTEVIGLQKQLRDAQSQIQRLETVNTDLRAVIDNERFRRTRQASVVDEHPAPLDDFSASSLYRRPSRDMSVQDAGDSSFSSSHGRSIDGPYAEDTAVQLVRGTMPSRRQVSEGSLLRGQQLVYDPAYQQVMRIRGGMGSLVNDEDCDGDIDV